MAIDVSFDFTMDSPHYWDPFWETDGGLGVGGSDPDSASKTLQRYHQTLWSRPLPCATEARERSLLSILGGFSFCERYDHC